MSNFTECTCPTAQSGYVDSFNPPLKATFSIFIVLFWIHALPLMLLGSKQRDWSKTTWVWAYVVSVIVGYLIVVIMTGIMVA